MTKGSAERLTQHIYHSTKQLIGQQKVCFVENNLCFKQKHTLLFI